MSSAVRFICFTLLFCGCRSKPGDSSKENKVAKQDTLPVSRQQPIDTVNTVSSLDYHFFARDVLGGHDEVLRYYFNKYTLNSCGVRRLDRWKVIEDFNGVHYIGNINHNATPDSVFVLGPLQEYCRYADSTIEEGKSFYFTDTSLPRLYSDSYCCRPDFLFVVGDIDEDGVSEIGQYFTSCSSRFKRLCVYTLKHGSWALIGNVIYDLSYADSAKSYSQYVRKTARNRFEMLEITDTKEEYRGKPHWISFTMK